MPAISQNAANPVRVSVIICTRNRADSLMETLRAISACTLPAGVGVELLVIDNGSTDATRSTVDEAAIRNPSVRYVRETKPGKMFALNAGLRHARGDLFVSTDDDVRPHVDWLANLYRAFEDEEVMAVQGRVLCVYDPPLPDWYDPGQLGGLADVDFGDAWRSWISQPCIGANMAFRRTVVDRVGNFRTCLGPGRSGFFDDTEFSWRMHSAGMRIDYRPEAFVYHHPFAVRLTRTQLWRAWFRNGLSSVLALHCSGKGIDASGLSLCRRFIRVAKLKTIALLRHRRPSISQDEMFFWMHLGSAYARLRGPELLRRELESEPGLPTGRYTARSDHRTDEETAEPGGKSLTVPISSLR